METKLYIIISASCMSQMEVPFLMNNSPDLFGDSDPDDSWATYQLNDEEIDHEPGIFGKVRVHDDYWNIDYNDEYKKLYNFNVRNSMEISESNLDDMLKLANSLDKPIALLSHAHNVQQVMSWSKDKPVTVVQLLLDRWERDIEMWAMREYNDLMQDDRNANYSDYNHSETDLDVIVDAYVSQVKMSNALCESGLYDICIRQSQWQTLAGLYDFWDDLDIESPSVEWIQKYYESFFKKQEFNETLLTQLREKYEAHEEYHAIV